MPKPTALLKGFEKVVATARPSSKRQVIFDGSTTGLALIVTPKGKRSFSIVARAPDGKQVWKRLGDPDLMTVARARHEAAEAVARVKAGEAAILPAEPPEAVPETFRQVAQRFIADWVDRGGKKQDGVPLRSKREIERHFTKYVFPHWESRSFVSVRRDAVTKLRRDIGANNGQVQGDRVLATLTKLFNWYRLEDEYYVNPIIAEMKLPGRARNRILSDDEIRTVWTACETAGVYGGLVRIALLTGQRREKVATMRWSDIQDGVWTIAAEAREKVNAGELKLPKLALTIIEAQPEIEGNPYIFAGRGKKAFNSFSDGKERLATAAPIGPWVFHDLRRTARSLMSRAGVQREIAERALGHVISGVEGVYDRHSYVEEKGRALDALAGLVDRILKGGGDNVIQLATGRTVAN